MKNEKNILAAYYNPIKLKLIDSPDAIVLTVNRIAGTKFTTNKKPIQLLKEMPALKIANQGFYANAKIKLKVNSKFEVASTEEILERQSAFMKAIFEDNKHLIKNIAFEKIQERRSETKTKTISNKIEINPEIQNITEYSKSNRLVILVMLIPLIFFILFIVIFYLNN